MPVYNGEKYLRHAIDSILNQTFKDFELIIVNDGSTDQTKHIITSYNDERIVLLNQKNQGVAQSLNNGLRIARGEYVRRHDADDLSLPESLEIQVTFLDNHSNYVMVCNQQAYMTSKGKIAWNFRHPNSHYFNGKELRNLSIKDFTLSAASPVVHGTACYRRKEINDIGIYRPAFIVSEDNDLWLRLLEKYQIAVLNKCTYFMRIHDESATYLHANKINYFRKLLLDFSNDRLKNGSDSLMRHEKLPPCIPDKIEVSDDNKWPNKKLYDEKRFFYSLVIDANDYALAKLVFMEVLKYNWKSTEAWKMLLFPLLGSKFINIGVKTKRFLRNYIGR